MQQNIDKRDSDIFELDLIWLFQNTLRSLRRFWVFVVLLTVIFAAAVTYLQQKSYTPTYKAYCTFSVHVVNKSTLSDTNSLYAVYYDQDLAQQLDATFSYLLTSDILKDDIKEYLGNRTVDGSITAKSIKGSNIFVLTTYSSTPEKAGELLEALMAVYYDSARFVVGDMENEVIEGPVVSRTPYNMPDKAKGIATGAAVGLLLSMGLLVLYTFLRRTVFVPEDLEKHVNMQCFGVVPLVQSGRSLMDDRAKKGSTHEQVAFRESFRGIARKLENIIEQEKTKIVLVTSAAASEGKSTVSQNLAESFALWGKNVVLVDGDLRKPSLYSRYGLKKERFDLEAVLSGEAKQETVIRYRNEGKLAIVLNSMPVKNPTVLIDSPEMKAFIDNLAKQADIVIIDTPPCGQLSDASVFQQYADGVLFVVQQDRLAIRQIMDAAENLHEPRTKLLGYVLNGAKRVSRGYGKYGYGKYSYGRYGYGKYSYSKYNYGDTENGASER